MVIKRSSKANNFDDSAANLGAANVEEALNKLDGRLDILEDLPTGMVKADVNSGWVHLPLPLYTKRTNLNNNTNPGWLDLGNGIDVVTLADDKFHALSTQITLGENYKAGDPLYFKLNWIPLSASTGNVVIVIDWIDGKGGNSDNMKGNTVRKTTIANGGGVDGECLTVTLDGVNEFGDSLEPGSTIGLSLGRLGTDSRDTFYGSIAFLSAAFYHKDSGVV